MTTPSEGEEMEPLVGTALAKAVTAAGEEVGKETAGILGRLLGPAADEIGEALRRYTAYRVNNVERIARNAYVKSDRRPGQVPARLAHRILDEGSFSDEELMAEYLGGVLAAGRTPVGRDDRAVVWADTIAGLSTLQLRAHFLLYREIAAAATGRGDLRMWNGKARGRTWLLVDLSEFSTALVADTEVGVKVALDHAVPGLHRVGLLGAYHWGAPDEKTKKAVTYDTFLAVSPSPAGLELYGWAQGAPNITVNNFHHEATTFGEEHLSRLQHAYFPFINEGQPEGTEVHDGVGEHAGTDAP